MLFCAIISQLSLTWYFIRLVLSRANLICFQVVVLFICIALFAGSLLALGGIISAKPLDDLRYKSWTGDPKSVSSPYASSMYIGWAIASAIALTVTGVMPIVSWFATYRFSLSSAACIGLFAGEVSFSTVMSFICFPKLQNDHSYLALFMGLILLSITDQSLLLQLSLCHSLAHLM